MTTNKKPAPHLKEEFFTEHLPYEISMLRATYELARAPKPAAEHNALVEAFLLHARNLVAFYKDLPACDFDPRMFTNASYQLSRDFVADGLLTKINRQTSHLTAKRISGAADELGPRDWALILRALEEETNRFVRALTKEYAAKWLLQRQQLAASAPKAAPERTASPSSYVLHRANLSATARKPEPAETNGQ